MSYGKSIRQKLLWLIIFNIFVWIFCSVDLKTSLTGELPTVFKVMFSAFSFCNTTPAPSRIHATGIPVSCSNFLASIAIHSESGEA